MSPPCIQRRAGKKLNTVSTKIVKLHVPDLKLTNFTSIISILSRTVVGKPPFLSYTNQIKASLHKKCRGNMLKIKVISMMQCAYKQNHIICN